MGPLARVNGLQPNSEAHVLVNLFVFRPPRSLFRVIPLIVVASVLFSCARVDKFEYRRDEFLRTLVQDSAPKPDGHSMLAWDFAGDELRESLTRWKTCMRQPVRVVRRKVSEERRVDSRTVWFKVVLGTLAAGAGTTAIIDPTLIGGEEKRDCNFAAGIAGASIGGLFLIWSAVDAFRAIDTEQDLGEFQLPVGEPHAASCHEDKGVGEAVFLRIPGVNDPLAAPIAEDGFARFDLKPFANIIEPQHTVGFLKYLGREEPVSLLLSPAVQQAVTGKVK